MSPAKSTLRKHKHHLETLARGVKHEREYVLKTAPASLDSLLHSIAQDIVNGKLTIPKNHRTKPKIDAILKFATTPSANDRKKMLRGNQKGGGFNWKTLGNILSTIAMPLLALI